MPNQPASLVPLADLVRQAAAEPDRAAVLLDAATDDAVAAGDHGAAAFCLLAGAAFAGQSSLPRAREALAAGSDLRTGFPFGPDGRPIRPPTGPPRHSGPRRPGSGRPREEPPARAPEPEPIAAAAIPREQRAREALERFRELVRAFVTGADARAAADLELWAARVLAPAHRSEALDLLGAARDAYAALGDPAAAAGAELELGDVVASRARLAGLRPEHERAAELPALLEAIEHYETARDALVRHRIPGEAARCLTRIADASVRLEAHRHAVRTYLEAAAELAALGDRYGDTACRINAASLLSGLGDDRAALDVLLAGGGSDDGTGRLRNELIGHLYARLGEQAEAVAALEAIEPQVPAEDPFGSAQLLTRLRAGEADPAGRPVRVSVVLP